uniref:U2 snRNP-associated SURP motif-containing protein n=2 Tax=Schistocephalus solidus TaxID=70667 RepID=A0A0X3NP24_SCHSO
MSRSKTKGFSILPLNSSKNTAKKVDKDEEAKTAEVLQAFVETFEQPSKVDRTWVKGGVVNPGNEEAKIDSSGPVLYKPTQKFGDKTSRTLETGLVEPKTEGVKKPVLGKKPGQVKKKSNLELFKEELKVIQEQRQQRHQSRASANTANASRDLPSSRGRPSDSHLSDHDFEDSLMDPSFGRRGISDRMRDLDYPYDYDVDRTTTNLFLGNLCPQMTEQQLCEVFGRYGPLASVKIMWPRTEEQRAVARNCGFVAFMNRVDSERAMERLRGKELLGYEMKLGWGKNVPIPAYPVYIPPPLLELIKPPSQSGLPFNAQPREWLKSVRSALKERAKLVTESVTEGNSNSSVPPIPPAVDRTPFNIHTMSKDALDKTLSQAIVKVVVPTDRSLLAVIHRMVEFVVREGPQFEAAIMHREEKNPQFRFLFDFQTPEHLYYRWKLWSVLHGESLTKWSPDEFRMFEGGPLWRPPPMNFFTNGMPDYLVEEDDYPYAANYVPQPCSHRISEEALYTEERLDSDSAANCRRTGLTEAQRNRLTSWINDLEPSKSQLGELMLWCLEHAESANDIADLIAASLRPVPQGESAAKDGKEKAEEKSEDHQGTKTIRPATTVSALIARLFLLSDILYNSCAKVPNASFFRKCFELRLPEIFVNIGDFYRELDSKMKSEQLKQKVMLCFRAWEEWTIYSNEFLIQLQNIFLGLLNNNKDDNVFEEDELAGVPLDQTNTPSRSAVAVASNVESIDGAPLVQYDGDPLDVDGSPLGSDKNEDYEGVPLNAMTHSPPTKSAQVETSAEPLPLFIRSKWESVDPSSAAEEAVTSTRWEIFAGAAESDVSKPCNLTEEDVDGKPLDEFGAVGLGLVAYDDDDALSPAAPSPPPPPSASHSVSSASAAKSSSSISESRRALLREIEVKVVKYQDELEASRKSGDSSVTDEAIATQVQRYRDRLLDRLETDDAAGFTADRSPSTKKSKSSSGGGGGGGGTSKGRSSSNRGDSAAGSTSSSKRHKHKSSREHASQRDRSPPRSLRDRDQRLPPRRRSSSSDDDDDTDPDHSVPPSSKRPRPANWTEGGGGSSPGEEIEEGEASDDDSFSAHSSSIRRGRHRESGEPRSSCKSPASNRRSRRSRSRTPSPTHRRSSGVSSSSRRK